MAQSNLSVNVDVGFAKEPILKLFADAWEKFERANQVIKTQGDYYTDDVIAKRHPAFTTRREAFDQIVKLWRLMHETERQETDDPMAKFVE